MVRSYAWLVVLFDKVHHWIRSKDMGGKLGPSWISIQFWPLERCGVVFEIARNLACRPLGCGIIDQV